MLCGGTSELKRPDDEANRVLDVVKTSLLTKTGHDGDGELPLSIFRIFILFSSVELLGYKSQVVAGTNYFLKVSLVGGGIGMWLKLNLLFFNRLKMH